MTSSVDETHLADDARQVTARYVNAMNSGDAETVLSFYTDDAVTIWEPGKPLRGQEHVDAVREFVASRPSMRAELRESYVAGDAALLVVDWSIDQPDGAGGTTHLTGTGLDVLRRGADGKWRYAVDNAYGDSV